MMPIFCADRKKTRKVRKTDPEYGQQKTKTYVAHEKHLDQPRLGGLIRELANKYRGQIHAFLEQVHARPEEGASGSFTFGGCYFAIKQAMHDFDLPFTLVTPGQWTKVMHQGTSPGMSAKDRSKLVALRGYPNIDFQAYNQKQREGIIDAVLIAEWGRRFLSRS